MASSIAFKCSSVISPPQPKACCKELQKTRSNAPSVNKQPISAIRLAESHSILIMSLCLYHSISISTSSVYLYVIYCCTILYHTKIYIHTLTTCTSSMASRICDLKLAASTLAASAAPTSSHAQIRCLHQFPICPEILTRKSRIFLTFNQVHSMLFKLLKTTCKLNGWSDKSVPGYSKGMFLHGTLRMDPKDQAQ